MYLPWTLILVGACASEPSSNDQAPAPPRPNLLGLGPTLVLPGTRVWIDADNLGDRARYAVFVTVSGEMSRVVVADLEREAHHLVWPVTDQDVSTLQTGRHEVSVVVRASDETGHADSQPMTVALEVRRELDPELDQLGQGIVYLNSAIVVEGGGLLQGLGEGSTELHLEGCFIAAGASGSCASSGKVVQGSLTVELLDARDRGRGAARLHPDLWGIHPGRFEGSARLVNRLPGGEQLQSADRSVAFELLGPRVHQLLPQAVSLGQYGEILGVGFLGDAGSTLIGFEGTFTPAGAAVSREVSFELVGRLDEPGVLQYVVEEGVGPGAVIDLRAEAGRLAGSWTPIVLYNGDQVRGESLDQALTIDPIKQVCWIDHQTTWTSGLRRFGLQAADARLRQRVLAVLERTFGGLNVEFRTEQPQDFSLYTKVEILGQDPNGLGLLGYDNIKGKDVGNARLDDRIGGVNALTQQDGFPGYGGVFVESLLAVSMHPPEGMAQAPLSTQLFDDLFDSFRPGYGVEASTAEVLALPQESDGQGCPVADDRQRRLACAVFALGNAVGNIAAHEFAHSLGLALPDAAPKFAHNPGDRPNRLMDAGINRSFAERAELQGQGPAVLCQEAFDYLRTILPSEQPDPLDERPPCDWDKITSGR